MQKKSWIYFLIFIAVVACYFLSAWKSTGFYHADEHFQLLEFANYKAGHLSADKLPWEFEAQIRPTLQVSIAYLSIKCGNLLGITSPHSIARSLRFLSLGLFLVAGIGFLRSYIERGDRRIKTLGFSLCLWFLPFLAVRFSSENWGGIFLILGWIFLKGDHKLKWTLSMIFLGLSFWFRFQMAFAILPLLLAFLLSNRLCKRDWLQFFGSALVVLLVGLVVDRWFYGNWVLTPWNYFKVNVLDNKAAEFGLSPWWQYLKWWWELPQYWVSIPFSIALLLGFFNRKFRLISIVFFSFLLIHSTVGHKEARFLFPMAILLLPLVHFLMEKIFKISESIKMGSIWKVAVFAFLVLNFTWMFLLSFRPVGIGEVTISEFIETDRSDKPATVIYRSWGNPHNPWEGKRPTYFYQDEDLHEVKADSPEEIVLAMARASTDQLYYVARKHHVEESQYVEFLKEQCLVKVKESLPSWQEQFNAIFPWMEWGEVIYLFKLKEGI